MINQFLNSNLAPHLKRSIFREWQTRQGEIDAYDEAINCRAVLATLKELLTQTEDQLSGHTGISGFDSLGASPRLFQEGRFFGLKRVIAFLETESSKGTNSQQEKIEPLVYEWMKFAQGKNEAFRFAMTQKADLALLERKHQELQEKISLDVHLQQTNENKATDQDPYITGFLQGLAEIISEITKEGMLADSSV